MANLYEFTVGSTSYRYTSGSKDVTYDSNTYTAIAIERSEIFLDFLQDSLTIKMQGDKQPASDIRDDIHLSRIEILVRTLKSASAEVIFKGNVVKSNYDLKKDLITLSCKRFPEGDSSLNRVFGKSCGFAWGEAFRLANPSAGGTFTASSGAGSATGTNFNTLVKGDFVWVQDAVYKVTGITGSTAMTMTPNAVSTTSGVSWYKVTDLKGCPVRRDNYTYNKTGMASDGNYTFSSSGYGQTDTLNGPAGQDLFADGADGIKKFLYGNVVLKRSSGVTVNVNRIVKVTSTSVQFEKPFRDSSVIDEILAYQGCSKQYNTCKTKFNANVYYGGFPYLDRVSPTTSFIQEPLPQTNRVVPEIIGTMWNKVVPFYTSPFPETGDEPDIQNTAPLPFSNQSSRTTEFPVNSLFLPLGAAICVKSDYLLGLKVKGEVIEIGKSVDDNVTLNVTGQGFEGDGITDGFFAPVQDSQRTYYNIDDFKKIVPQSGQAGNTSHSVSRSYIADGAEKAGPTIQQDPDDSSSKLSFEYGMIINTSQFGRNNFNKTYIRKQLRQYIEFYSGTNRLISPVFDIIESSFSTTTPTYPDLRYVDLSYLVFGPTVYPRETLAFESNRNEIKAISGGAFVGNLKVQGKLASNKLHPSDYKEYYPEYEAFVYHAPSISSYDNKDFVYEDLPSETAWSNFTSIGANITSGSDTVTSQEVTIASSASVASNHIRKSGASFTSDLKVGDYITLDPAPTSAGLKECVPAKVKLIIDDENFLVEGPLLATTSTTGAVAKVLNPFSGGGTVLTKNIKRTPAFKKRPDFNSGDAVKVGSNFYIVGEITSETTFKIIPNALETVGSFGAVVTRQNYLGANPANVLYYIMNSILNIVAGDIDTTSFTDARTQLHTEGLGVNIKIDTLATLRSKINDILDLINGVLYWDSSAGKFKLGLMRDSNYGSQTINSVKKTYTTDSSSNMTVETSAYDDLYTHVSITYKSPFDPDEEEVKFDSCNETTSNVLGYARFKEVSNEFITNRNAAQFYMNLKFNQYTQIQNKVKFRVPIDDIDLLHQGCLVAYNDPDYDLTLLKIRVDKISGFNEFASYLSVEGHIEYSVEDYSIALPERGKSVDYSDIAELVNLEIAPCSMDPLGLNALEDPNPVSVLAMAPAYVLPYYNSRSLTSGARITFKDSSGEQISEISLPSCGFGQLATGGYAPTGFIDNSATGILVDLPANDQEIKACESSDFTYYALISKNILGTIEDSDYELIAFKKLDFTGLTAPTSSAGGQCRITKILRNLCSQNYYDGDPYPSSGSSKFVSGKTNVTGQFTHSTGASIYIFIGKNISRFQSEKAFFSLNTTTDKYDIQAEGTTMNAVTNGSNIIPVKYSFTDPSETSEGNTSAPYDWKLFYPPPPAKIYGYTKEFNTQENYKAFVIYISPANDRSGASWRSASNCQPNMRADKSILIEFTNTSMNGPASIVINPGQSFTTNYAIRGPINNADWNTDGSTKQGSYIAGHLIPSSYETNFVLDDDGTTSTIISTSSLGTHPQGGSVFELRDQIVNKTVTNYACVMIAAPDVTANIDFYISQIRPDMPDIKSERRKITLSYQTETLQIV